MCAFLVLRVRFNDAQSLGKAAIDYLTNAMTPGYSPGEFAIMSVFGLLDDDGQAVDLSQQHELRGKNYTHLGGACHRSAVSLTFRPGYEVLGKSVGCLDGPDHAAAEDAPPPKPFAVALVNPPKANGMAGGQVVSVLRYVCHLECLKGSVPAQPLTLCHLLAVVFPMFPHAISQTHGKRCCSAP
jgi:hypothetical protein